MNGALPTPSPQSTIALSTEIYTVFAGQIDQEAVKRIFNTLTVATNPTMKITHIHLLFQSTGGFVGDGIALYNFFRVLPIDLTIYNAGSVQSVATIAYLGAKKRKVSAHATFMIHRTYLNPQYATTTRLQAATKSLLVDDQRTEAILKAHIKLPDEQWKELDYHDLTFSADEAVKYRFADEMAEFAPPKGTQLYNI